MRKFLISILAVMAAACQVEQAPPANQANLPTAPEPSPAAPFGRPDAPAPSPYPAPAPAPLAAPTDPVPPTPENEKSAAAATRVLDDYFAAIATKEYRRAYGMWSGNGAATGMTFPQFVDSFAKYRIYDGKRGKPGTTEGAAGSIYIEVPVQVTGVLAKGGGFLLEGPMSLKRVNDVDGSTAQQRRWHIASSALKPRP